MISWLKSKLLSAAERFIEHPRIESALRRALPARAPASDLSFSSDALALKPYADVGGARLPDLGGGSPIFVSARFRTGSTLLWSLLRHLPNTTAFYEPLNERRWFSSEHRGSGVDPSHRGVDDYWSEYDGLAHLERLYDPQWTDHRLYLDQWSNHQPLKAYIDALVDHASGRAVLQFNRADFRLAWLRHNYPDCRIVHLYRHPREQWVSTLFGDWSFPIDGTLEQFATHDRFYLTSWVRDLQWQLAPLSNVNDKHPYLAFYVLWKLSLLIGKRYSDVSISFESLCGDPAVQFQRILTACSVDDSDGVAPDSVVGGLPPAKSGQYAELDWYLRWEALGDALISGSLSRSGHQT